MIIKDKLSELCEQYTKYGNIWVDNYNADERFLKVRRMETKYMGSIDSKSNKININTFFPKKDQLVTLMHEILHKHPFFLFLQDNRLNQNLPELEKAITKYAKYILRTRPNIKSFLEEKLDESSKYRESLPF